VKCLLHRGDDQLRDRRALNAQWQGDLVFCGLYGDFLCRVMPGRFVAGLTRRGTSQGGLLEYLGTDKPVLQRYDETPAAAHSPRCFRGGARRIGGTGAEGGLICDGLWWGGEDRTQTQVSQS
jgi:hypothetical protein